MFCCNVFFWVVLEIGKRKHPSYVPYGCISNRNYISRNNNVFHPFKLIEAYIIGLIFNLSIYSVKMDFKYKEKVFISTLHHKHTHAFACSWSLEWKDVHYFAGASPTLQDAELKVVSVLFDINSLHELNLNSFIKRALFIQIVNIKAFIKNRNKTEPNRGFLLYRTEPYRTEGLVNRHTPTYYVLIENTICFIAVINCHNDELY